MVKRFAVLMLGLVVLCSVNGEIGQVDARPPGHANAPVENVIFMIPDGFSTGHASNYRIYKEDEVPVWDSMLVGMMKTESADNRVTDSAAAGTAMATGVKTNNDMVSMLPDGTKLTSILKVASEDGKATGLVATSPITHATPAVFGANTESRNHQREIARQYVDHEIDVLLGGGKNFFIQDDRNLIEELKEKGYTFIENKKELLSVEGDKLLGLFADDAMAPELDREHTEEPSLAEMTKTAIHVLSKNQNGFFLMVEGSQIDWASHAHDPAWAMKDIEAFEDAVKEALEFAEKDERTLVVIVGDHDTGGMTVGGYDKYDSQVQMLRDVTATGDYMASQLSEDRSNAKKVLKKFANIDLTDREFRRLKVASNPAFEINTILSERAVVGWTSNVHTGEHVPLYAFGPGSDLFSGLIDNTDVPKIMAGSMGTVLVLP